MSLLPAMLRVKAEAIARILPMRPSLRDVLLGGASRERGPLNWLENFESGNWEICEALAKQFQIRESELATPYADAIQWADEVCGELL